jgi:hypothetical protein
MRTRNVSHTMQADTARYLYAFQDLFSHLVESVTKDKQYTGDTYLISCSKLTITANSGLSCCLCFSG